MIMSCGSNDFGELGLPTNGVDDGTMPITIPSSKPTIVDIGLVAGEKVEMLKCGQRHVLVLVNGKDGQRVIGWGAARKGELSPTFKSDTSRKGKGKGVAQASILPPTEIVIPGLGGSKVIDISLGASHSVVLLNDGRVLAWGSDGKGQISGLSEMQGVRAIATTWNGTYLLSEQGLWSQGSNTHSQLLRPDGGVAASGPGHLEKGNTAERLVAGTEHILVIDAEERALWVGGWNEHGNLGVGDQVDRDRLTKVETGGEVLAAWGGCAASWIWVDED
jgi:protein ATS1